MGNRRRFTHDGPETYPVSEAIKAGMIVAGHTDGKARKGTAGDAKVLGVAEIDAKPATNPVTTDADGFETINLSQLPPDVTVGFGRYPVTYAADCAFGKALKAGAAGTVTPWVPPGINNADPDVAVLTGDSADLIIGWCDEPGGVVVVTKATGLATIGR